MNAKSARAYVPTVVIVLITAAVAVVSTLAVNEQLGPEESTDRDRLCAAARDWREAAQAFAMTSNTVNRHSPEGRTELGEEFKVAANVVFPSSGLTATDSRLVTAVEEWNAAAETWWFSLYDAASVSSAKQNPLVLALNEAYRKVNPHLVDICRVPAIELYTN